MRSAALAADPPIGDVALLEKTFLEHQGRVFRAAYRITGNLSQRRRAAGGGRRGEGGVVEDGPGRLESPR